jgi:hypothetical protein
VVCFAYFRQSRVTRVFSCFRDEFIILGSSCSDQEKQMKFLCIAICMLLVSFLNSGVTAGQIYTWTDENGNLHVTDTPPPPQGKVKETLDYQEKTAAEIQELERRREARKKQQHEESIHQQAAKAAKQAAKADEDAQEAAQIAEKEYENAMRTYERYGKTQDKRKKFRKRIRRAFDQADSAQQRASEAAENARQAQGDAQSSAETLKTLKEQNQQ